MIEHSLDKERGILFLRPKSAIEASDFEQLARTVDPYIVAKGDLNGVVVEAEGFPGWDSLGAMATHFRFVRDHHKHIRRIAIVTDAKLGDLAERFGSHFIAATVKHFPAGDRAAAERWITG